MSKFLCILLILLSSIKITSCDIDYLLNGFNNNELTIDERIGFCHAIAESYAASDLDSTYKYGMIGVELSKKADNKRMEAIFYRYVASTFTYTKRYDSGMYYIDKSIDIAKQISDKDILQYDYLNKGDAYLRQGMYESAIDNFMEAIDIYPGDDRFIPKFSYIDATKTYLSYYPKRTHVLSYVNIGECYLHLKNYKEAENYYTKAEEIIKTDENDISKGGVLPQIYNGKSLIYLAENKIDLAEKELLKAIEIVELPISQVECRESLIKVYIIKKEYDKALKLADECIEISKNLNDPVCFVKSFNSYSDIYKANGDYENCLKYAQKAWNIDSISLNSAPITAFNMSYSYSFLGDKNKADYFFRVYEYLNEQKSLKTFQNSIAEMETKHKLKDVRMESLYKERQLYKWIIFCIITIVIIVAVAFFLYYKNKQKKRQLVVIASQAMLDGEMTERSRISRDLHDRLSGNLSAVRIKLKNCMPRISNDECNNDMYLAMNCLDNCIEDVRRTAHDLMPTSLRYGLKTALNDYAAQFQIVHFHFFGKEIHLEDRKEYIIYCCACELINNAIKHSQASLIDLQLVQNKDITSLTVQDNGIGFDIDKHTNGIGLLNIKNRVASCNGKLYIISSPEKGTEITIDINTI